MKLKLFSDKGYLPEGARAVIMLYPFWGKPPEGPKGVDRGCLDRYSEIGRSFFKMSSLAEADVGILPISWEQALKDNKARELAIQFAKKVNRAGKPVIIFFWSDLDEDVPIENSIIFRTSLYRSERRPDQFAMPAWSEDFVERYLNGQLPIREKRKKPVVGFCGSAPPLRMTFGLAFRRKLKDILDRSAALMGIRRGQLKGRVSIRTIRLPGLQILSRSPLVETNFIIKNSFLGGALLPNGEVNTALMQKIRSEYVQNMVDSDYIFCCCGGGNYSYRLYETLCCGRIPVFIDTDCVLPYDFAIDWKKYCVWVDANELPQVARKVAEFHNKLSPQDFINLQHQCRGLWQEWLSPEGFFSNFYRHFQKGP